MIRPVRLLGPIFRIELLTTVRRARHYIVRGIYGALLLFVFWASYAATFGNGQVASIQTGAEFGELFFYNFAVLQLIASMVVAAAVTSGTIAEERERRTIEYLFATDLSNAEIVLGKLASRLLHMFAFLATAVPVLALALLFGGVDADHLVQLFAMTLSTVVVSASISMCISVWTTRPRDAFLRAFIVLLGLSTLPLLVWGVSLTRTMFSPLNLWIAPINEKFLDSNPFLFLLKMAEWRAPVPIATGWVGVKVLVVNHLTLSLAMIALAVWRVRKVHLGKVTRSVKPSSGRWRRWLWRPALGNRPMLWKEMYAEQAIKDLNVVGRVVVVLLFLAILAPLGRTFYKCYTRQFPRESFQDVATYLGGTIACAFLLVLGARAASSVTTEKEKQTWDVLLSTPITGLEVVIGKSLGNVYSLRWLLALFALVWIMAGILLPYCFGLGLLTALTIALLSPFFTNIGLFFSLRSRSSSRAMLGSLLVSIMVGGVYLIALIPFVEGSLDRGDNRFLWAPCAPWLVFWPGRYDPRAHSYLNDWPPEVYVLGVTLYVVAGAILVWANVRRFDQCVGRTGPHAIPRTVGVPNPDLNSPDKVTTPAAPFASISSRP